MANKRGPKRKHISEIDELVTNIEIQSIFDKIK